MLSLASLTVLVAALQGAPAPAPLRLHAFSSTVFGNTRFLRVLVPPGYDDSLNAERRYPVLYLNDGQNLFDSTTAIFGPREWQVDETVTSLIATGRIPPLIVVGVDNAGRRARAHEYLPYVDEFLQPRDSAPQGSLYPRFLVDEVLPYIDAHYRTLTGAEHTALGGSSYGALVSLYTALTRPGTFGRLLLESPSLYVDGEQILRLAGGASRWPSRVYVGVGTNETNHPDCDPATIADPGPVDDVESLALILRMASPRPKFDVVVEPCAVHNEFAWARRLPAALTFLYGP